MKRYIFIALSILALCSCVNETLEPVASSEKGKAIVFEGAFAPSTKVQFSDAENGIHALTWSLGDEIGVFTYNGATTNDNMKAVLHEETAGSSTGVFIPEDRVITIPPEEEGEEPTEEVIELEYPQSGTDAEDFLIYYPYRNGMKINADDFCLHAEVAHDQIQNNIGDREVCANGLATALARVEPGTNKATFTLNHQLAYLCVKATSSEFAGYQLHAVHLFDKNGQAALSGEFSIDPQEGTFTVKSGATRSSVRVDVKNHDFSAVPEKNELYLAVLPGDFSSADMYFEVTFINEKGATKNIPMEFNKICKFPAGSLTTIDLGEFSSSMVNIPWYTISEERDLVKRCAYGSQNTYFAQRPAEGASTPVTIDVKARGDFSRVKEPKYYALLAPAEYGSTLAGGRQFLSLDGTTDKAAMSAGWESGKYESIGSDYEFTVYVVSPTTKRQGMWGTVAIYDEDKNILWSYMIQGYLEDDVPQDMDYGDFKLLDRFLGQGIGSVKAVDYKDLATDSPAYFQWGRKDPFIWTNSKSSELYVAKWEKFEDVADAASSPCARVMVGSDSWYEGETRFDLWGGSNNTDADWYDPQAVGHKTVYDPCPEGYRVPDAKVFKKIKETAQPWEVSNGLAHQIKENIKTDTPFTGGEVHGYRKAHSALAVQLPGGAYDYFPYCGYMNSSAGKAYNERTMQNNNWSVIMCTWSNSATASDIAGKKPFAVMLEYGYWGSTAHMGSDNDMGMCMAFPVRCQKID